MARRGLAGAAGLGMARQGEAGRGRAGMARLGRAWPGAARLGTARRGLAGVDYPPQKGFGPVLRTPDQGDPRHPAAINKTNS
jgi:hypothetical protein